jgi:hypothetical protein
VTAEREISAGTSRRRSALSFALKLLVSAAALALIAARVDVAGTLAQLAKPDPELLGLACGVLVLQWPLTALRLSLLSERAGARLSALHALRIQIGSLLMSQAVPTVGGDAFRSVALQRAGLSWTKAIGVAITDRYFALLGLALIVLAGQPWLRGAVPDSPLVTVTSVGLVGVLALLAGLVASDRLMPRSAGRVLTAFSSVGPALRDALADSRVAPLALLSSVAAHLITVSVVTLLAGALHLELSVTHAALLVPPIVLLAALPISVAGWGVREGSSVALLSLADIPASSAVAVAVLLGVLQLLVSLPGALSIMLERRHTHSTP